jgi:hypothetical protein
MICTIALVPLTSRAQAPTVVFQADLGKALAQPGGQVALGGVQWTCNTVHCSGKGPASDSVAACHALSQRYGALKSFSAGGRSVDVKKCAAAPTAMQSAPMKALAPVGVAVMAQPGAKPAAPAAPPASPPAAPPAKKAAAPAAAATASGTIAVHTATLRVNGTGPVSAVAGASGTIAVRTTGLRVTGTGPVAAAGASSTPIAVRTAPLSVTGTGPVVSH